ncbi:MAG: acyltransferase [Deltaproteobacteria bacterium]|nr:acyltransferase [Deltaproteobacteria bacterium]
MKVQAQTTSTRLPRLDGIRGVAVLLILQLHLLNIPETNRLARALSSAGWIGVDLFFVLSGFLITGILVRSRSRPGYCSNFCARRALRMFPLYFAYLLAYYLFVIRLGLVKFDAARSAQAAHELPWLWFYGTGILIAKTGGFLTASLNHFWTLAVEEHFYLLWPALVFLCPPARLKWLCVLGVGLVVGLRVVMLAWGCSPFGLHVLTPFRMDGFLVGGGLALLINHEQAHARLRTPARVVAWLCSAALLTGAVLNAGLNWGDAWMQSAGYTLLAFGFAGQIACVLLARPGTLWARLFEHPALGSLGKYSYALYVLHVPINIALGRLWPSSTLENLPGGWVTATLVHATVTCIVSVCLALASWHILEKHFLRLKENFRAF